MSRFSTHTNKWVMVLAMVLGLSHTVGTQSIRLRSGQPSQGGGFGDGLLTVDDVVGPSRFLCGFKVFTESSNGFSMDNAPLAMAYNPTNGRMFMSSSGNGYGGNLLSEVTIPTCVYGDDPSELNRVTTINQGLQDALVGNDLSFGGSVGDLYSSMEEVDHLTAVQRDAGSPPARLWSLHVHDGELYNTTSMFYAGGSEALSHGKQSLNLSLDDFTGHVQVGGSLGGPLAGHTSGYIIDIPLEYQDDLGFEVATGQCCQSVISRNSYGPSLGGFDHTQVTAANHDLGEGNFRIPWDAWIDYPSDHATLGCWDLASVPCDNTGLVIAGEELFGYTTALGGGVIFPGTKTVAFFGSGALPAPNRLTCYGDGTDNIELHGEQVEGQPPGVIWCYDPYAVGTKSNHQYPRQNYVWLYNIDDIIDAKNGILEPWEVVPYAAGPFNFPYDNDTATNPFITAVTYDEANNYLYINHYKAELNPCCQLNSIVWRVQANLAGGGNNDNLLASFYGVRVWARRQLAKMGQFNILRPFMETLVKVTQPVAH